MTTDIGLAHLIIQQSGTGLTKTESHYQLGFQGITETLSSYNDWKYYNLYEPGNWSFPSLTGYHEATFKMDAANNGYVQLYNNTDSSSLDVRSSNSTTTDPQEEHFRHHAHLQQRADNEGDA